MHSPDALSEEIVMEERRRSYLRDRAPSVEVSALDAPVRPVEAPVEDPLFDRLDEEYEKTVRMLARKYLRCFKTGDYFAEDLVQNTWAAVRHSLPSFADARSERAIICTIAKYTFTTFSNNWQTRSRGELVSLTGDSPVNGSDRLQLDNDFSALITKSEIQQCAEDIPSILDLYGDDLRDSLGELTERERSIVERHWSGETLKSIGVDLGVSDHITRTIYTAAINKIVANIRGKFGIVAPPVQLNENPKGLLTPGTTLGYLRVIEHAGKDRHGSTLYRCRCERPGCGKIVTTDGSILRRKKSCGCLRLDLGGWKM